MNSPTFQAFPYPEGCSPSCQVCRAEFLFGTLSITVKIVENDKFFNKCVLRTRVCIFFNNFGGRDRPGIDPCRPLYNNIYINNTVSIPEFQDKNINHLVFGSLSKMNYSQELVRKVMLLASKKYAEMMRRWA